MFLLFCTTLVYSNLFQAAIISTCFMYWWPVIYNLLCCVNLCAINTLKHPVGLLYMLQHWSSFVWIIALWFDISTVSANKICNLLQVPALDWPAAYSSGCLRLLRHRLRLIIMTSSNSLTQQPNQRHWSVSAIDWLRSPGRKGVRQGSEGGESEVWRCDWCVLVTLWSRVESHSSLLGNAPVHFDSWRASVG